MKSRLLWMAALVGAVVIGNAGNTDGQRVARPEIGVWFSPNGGSTAAIVAEIGAAQSQISVQAYELTSEPIIDALIRATQRGVKVFLMLDRSVTGTTVGRLFQAGVLIGYDTDHGLVHSKVMVIDNRLVITGSFNYSARAESRNIENVIMIGRPDVALTYQKHFNQHWAHVTAPVPSN